jgi:putative chitinase
MELTLDQLKKLLPKNPYVDHWHHALEQLFPDYEINTAKRIAAFIAQCSHESAGFTALKENLNYKAETLTRLWPKLFPAGVAMAYASMPNKQEAIANRAYGGRMGNGAEASGEGWKFHGRGFIQLTGKENYTAFTKSIGEDCIANPDLVASKYALASAAWFFNKNGLHKMADGGANDDTVTKITKRVNGGTIGLPDRIKHFKEYYHLLA